jgi:hypothetical protein
MRDSKRELIYDGDVTILFNDAFECDVCHICRYIKKFFAEKDFEGYAYGS